MMDGHTHTQTDAIELYIRFRNDYCFFLIDSFKVTLQKLHLYQRLVCILVYCKPFARIVFVSFSVSLFALNDARVRGK